MSEKIIEKKNVKRITRSQIQFQFNSKVKPLKLTNPNDFKEMPEYKEYLDEFNLRLKNLNESADYLQLMKNNDRMGEINKDKLVKKKMKYISNLIQITEKDALNLARIWFFLEYECRGHSGIGRFYHGCPKEVIEMEAFHDFWAIWNRYKSELKKIGVQAYLDNTY
jgi:hypothetical protein